jgi:chemotaxis protein MotB
MPVKRGGHGGGGGGGHDAAGMMRWLLTYADLITLLLIMFILLYSAATQDISKFKNLAQYLRAAFGGVLQQGPTFLQGQGDKIIPDLVQRVSSAVESAGTGTGTGGGAASIFKNERGIVVRLMTDNVLFDAGSVDLNPEMKQILDAISGPIKEANLPVLVEGHTDSLPVKGGGRYVDNMELSTIRASKVVRYLIESGKVSPARLSAAGYAEYRPVALNNTEEGRRRNRRIDIVILEGSGPSAK